MKKFLTTILAVIMVFGTTVAFAGQSDVTQSTQQVKATMKHVFSTTGEIKNIDSNGVTVIGEGPYKEIVLHIAANTHIVDANKGTAINLKTLKKGDKITAYYGRAVTRSLPPQGTAIALVVGTAKQDNAGMYMKVGKLEKLDNGSIKVLCTNSDRLVTISSKELANINDVKVGSELIVWYQAMTLSIPAQAHATKVVLLPSGIDIKVYTLAGTIVVNGQELAFNENTADFNTKDRTLMLPLRVIAENLGYDVIWHETTQTIELRNGANSMNMTIDSKDYGKAKMLVKLNHAPQLVNGTTLAPIEFFTEVMDLKVEVINSHI